MAAGDDLAQARGNPDITDLLSKPIDERTAIWHRRCLEQVKLTFNYNKRRTNRDLLLDPNRSPRCFSINKEVMKKVIHAKVEEIEGVSDLSSCTKTGYATCLKLLLEAEEMYQAVEMRKHDLATQRLCIEMRGRNVSKFGFRVANLANKSPSIVAKDYVILHVQNGGQLAMQILDATDDYIHLPKDAVRRYYRYLQGFVKVSFISAGVPFRMCQKAIEDLQSSATMQNSIFEEVGSPENEVKIQATGVGDFKELDERLDKLNASQRAAVVGILEAKCRPKPYILFGPPGTGKTHTLVEAVVQVYKRTRKQHEQPIGGETCVHSYYFLSDLYDSDDSDCTTADHSEKFRILVCINSNNCTDELHQKIKQELPGVRVTRLSAGSFPKRGNRSEIFVTTNIKSGAYKDIEWKFDYVFVDEAGHANMAESLVPASVLKEDGCLVLAGDPHQLGPVVTCDGAAKMGLEQSLLERLFKFKLYQKDPVTREYDGRYITMLQDCYRCDPRILTTCNRLFYDNKLRCINSTPRGLLKVLRLTGPLQMRHVSGKQAQMAGSDSWYNQAEIDVCVNLVKRLYSMGIEPNQIGVTSPYKLQAYRIRQALKSTIEQGFPSIILKERFRRGKSHEHIAKLPDYDVFSADVVQAALDSLFLREIKWDCKADSIDAFQGGEKEIMIISTVRTGGNTRFISDKRRFNVAISRAKWLVIVVGDFQTLRGAEYWDELLRETVGEVNSWPESVYCSQPFSQLQPLFNSR